MSFGLRPLLAAAALAGWLGAGAQTIPLSPEQRQLLGIRFTQPVAADRMDLPAIARVVVPPAAQAVVAAPAPGLLTSLAVALGDPVAAGQRLGTFSSPLLIETGRALAEARSQAALAAAARARDEALLAEGIIPASRLESSRARDVQARDAVAAREAELANAGWPRRPAGSTGGALVLSAPLAGTITELPAALNERSDTGQVLFRIVRLDRLELDAVTRVVSPKVSAGQSVRWQAAAASPGDPDGAIGKVVAVLPPADGTSGQRLRIRLAGGHTLAPGQTLPVSIAMPLPAGTLRLPSRALTRRQPDTLVFVQTPEGVRAAVVNVLADDGDSALVRATLPDGASVAVAGVAALKARLIEGNR